MPNSLLLKKCDTRKAVIVPKATEIIELIKAIYVMFIVLAVLKIKINLF